MGKALRWVSAILFISALAALITLLASDALNQLRLTELHRQAGALSFMLIGASYVGLQLSSTRPVNETLKELLLGIAFLLWGAEQFLPPSRWVTVMDTLVVLIFVTDLSLIIFQRLRRRGKEKPLVGHDMRNV